ncbi:hypothetical protein LASUN_14310 [Lentilactobacillus sunkii]|uniref:MucBP domain-containing protein n=1 Tax=Lentilactobacillus sunkii TaxID=481719 RepID=A0A1E7XCN1_9LACO|nr:LPXTG cell wall anchor domain-containing protein [Lentilactobacillus sunkii]OFA10877.1 hypothetical protein LASUN_14310 [Lentilactobacillus sunkii]
MKKAILLSVSLGILGASSPLINEQVAKADTSTANVSKGSTGSPDKNNDKQVKVIEKYYVKSLLGIERELKEVPTMLDVDVNGNIAVPNHPGYTTPKAVITRPHYQGNIEVIYNAIPAQVTINHLDENGKTLWDSIPIKKGTLNGTYAITPQDSTQVGYELINKESLNGDITSQNMNVDLIYRRLDSNNQSVESKNVTVKNKTNYHANDKQVDVKNDKNGEPVRKSESKPEKQEPKAQNNPFEEPTEKPAVTQSTSTIKQEPVNKVETKSSEINTEQALELPETAEVVSTNDRHATNLAQLSPNNELIVTPTKVTETGSQPEAKFSQPEVDVKDDKKTPNVEINSAHQQKDKPGIPEINHQNLAIKEMVASKTIQKDNSKNSDLSTSTVKDPLVAQSSVKEATISTSKDTPKKVTKAASENSQLKTEEQTKETTTQPGKSPEQPKEKTVTVETINNKPAIQVSSTPLTPKKENANKDVDGIPSKSTEKEISKVVKVPQVDKKAVTSKNQTNEVLKGMPAKGPDSGETKDESTTLSKKSTERFESYHLQGIDAHGKSLFNKTLQLTPSEAIKFQSENVEFYGYDLVSTKLDKNSKTFTLNYKPKRVTFKIINVDEDGKTLSSDSVQLDFGEEQTYTPKLVPGYQAKQASQTLKADNLLPTDIEFNYTKLPDKKAELTKDSRQKGDRLNKEEHHSLIDKEANSHKSANNDEESDQKLPQTGEQNSYLSVLTGLSLLIVLIGKKILKRYI